MLNITPTTFLSFQIDTTWRWPMQVEACCDSLYSYLPNLWILCSCLSCNKDCFVEKKNAIIFQLEFHKLTHSNITNFKYVIPRLKRPTEYFLLRPVSTKWAT